MNPLLASVVLADVLGGLRDASDAYIRAPEADPWPALESLLEWMSLADETLDATSTRPAPSGPRSQGAGAS